MLQMIIQPTKYEKLSNFQGFVSSKRTEYMAAIHGYNQTKRGRKESKETKRQTDKTNVDEKNLKRQTDNQTKRGRKESKEKVEKISAKKGQLKQAAKSKS
jgi:hypothetical protein